MGEWAEYYDLDLSVTEYLGNLSAHAALLEAVLAGGPRTVLEVGVGTGIMGIFLSQWGVEVTGIDNDASVLEQARALSKRFLGSVAFVEGDAFSLQGSLRGAQFDVVFSQGFFEHFEDETIRALVREQLAVAPRIVFSVPGDGYPQRDFGNERLMSVARWAAVVEGLGELEVRGYGVTGSGFVGRLTNRLLGRAMHVLVVISR